jgi:hypothetical protein
VTEVTEVIVTHPSVLVHDGRTHAEGETMHPPTEDVTAYEELGIVSRPEKLPPAR